MWQIKVKNTLSGANLTIGNVTFTTEKWYVILPAWVNQEFYRWVLANGSHLELKSKSGKVIVNPTVEQTLHMYKETYNQDASSEALGLSEPMKADMPLKEAVLSFGASAYSAVGHTHTGYVSTTGYNKANWDEAFSWGNHGGLYSLLGHTHDAPTWSALSGKPTTFAGFGLSTELNTTLSGYATVGHSHDYSGIFASINHSHDYSALFAGINHSHDYSGLFAGVNHIHSYTLQDVLTNGATATSGATFGNVVTVDSASSYPLRLKGATSTNFRFEGDGTQGIVGIRSTGVTRYSTSSTPWGANNYTLRLYSSDGSTYESSFTATYGGYFDIGVKTKIPRLVLAGVADNGVTSIQGVGAKFTDSVVSNSFIEATSINYVDKFYKGFHGISASDTPHEKGGLWMGAYSDSISRISAGSLYSTAGQHLAGAISSTTVSMNGANLDIMANSGLTIGGLFTPTIITRTNTVGLEVLTGMLKTPRLIAGGLADDLATSVQAPTLKVTAGASITGTYGDGSSLKIADGSWIRPITAGSDMYLTNDVNPAVGNRLHFTSSNILLNASATGVATVASQLELGSTGTSYLRANTALTLVGSNIGSNPATLSLLNGILSIGIAEASVALNTNGVNLTSLQGATFTPMTSTQRDAITTKNAGKVIYNSTTNKLQVHNGTTWIDLH